MSTPGLIWLPGVEVNSADLLHARLLEIFGSNLIGLYIGEDLVVDGSGNVTSWPGRVGLTATPITASKYRVLASVNSRRGADCIALDNTNARGLSVSGSTAIKSLLCVSQMTRTAEYVSVSTYICSVNGADNHAIAFTTPKTTRDLYTGTGWSHYIDGVSSESLPDDGVHVIEATKSTATGTGFRIGCSSPWQVALAPIEIVVALSSVSTLEQRTNATIALRAYYYLTV